MQLLVENILQRDHITRADADRIQQRFVLAVLFYSTTGGNWKVATNWLNSAHECFWYSIGDGRNCEIEDHDNGLIFAYHNLSLRDNNLQGTLPPYLFDFLSLYRLDLSSNHLTDKLDDLVGSRGHPRSVVDLDLHNNSVSGNMIQFIKYFDQLESLWLQHNKLSGSLPVDIWQRSHLQQLGLSFNQLSGPLPPGLGMLTGKSPNRKRGSKELYLDNNQFSGTLPTELRYLGTHLGHLWLHNNKLIGTIPTDVDMCYLLKTLTLANNQLEGTLATELLAFTELREFDLSNNRLFGTIGSEIGTMRDLQVLRLGLNEFSGSIPSEMGLLTALTDANFANNSFHGSIPPELSILSNLELLDLSGNANMTGVIPDPLCSIPTLKVDCAKLCGCYCGTCVTNITNATTQLQDDGSFAESKTNVCYFVLAGQSNVQGFGDLGHLREVTEEEPFKSRYRTAQDDWTVLEDVFVTFDNEYGDFKQTQEGKLSPPRYGTDKNHFGPEVGFGFEMADLAIANGSCTNIVIVKTAGVASLADQWNAPRGVFFGRMIGDIRDAMSRVNEITGTNTKAAPILSGLAWLHGYADVYDPASLAQYETNLETWVKEAREVFSSFPGATQNLPIVIGQMGGRGPIENADPQVLEMQALQARVASKFDYMALTNTSQFVRLQRIRQNSSL